MRFALAPATIARCWPHRLADHERALTIATRQHSSVLRVSNSAVVTPRKSVSLTICNRTEKRSNAFRLEQVRASSTAIAESRTFFHIASAHEIRRLHRNEGPSDAKVISDLVDIHTL